MVIMMYAKKAFDKIKHLFYFIFLLRNMEREEGEGMQR